MHHKFSNAPTFGKNDVVSMINKSDRIRLKKISFGIGRPSRSSIQAYKGFSQVIEDISKAEFEPQRELVKLAEEQLGTVGGGNHFVDLFEDQDGWLWIGLHFGSRGFGHKTASGFMTMFNGNKFTDKPAPEKMDAKPMLFDISTYIGQAYIEAMQLAGKYAMAGRAVVMQKIYDILDLNANDDITMRVHNHHNFAWLEPHLGENWWVVRKGCTPAAPGQQGFIGANMSDYSCIVEGIAGAESAKGLHSTVHGAGRVMSRTQAAGKMKWKRGADGKKRPERVSAGLIDWEKVQETMQHRGIELRGGGADEAPLAYKKLGEVLNHHQNTIKILHTLRPIGVAMAGANEHDPYKD